MRENRNNKKKTGEYRIHESRERQTEWNKYSGKQLNMLFINEMDIRFLYMRLWTNREGIQNKTSQQFADKLRDIIGYYSSGPKFSICIDCFINCLYLWVSHLWAALTT